ncbi:MAG: hypothetical protein IJ280_05760 [Bacteroidales bacterium]|nr:hypothetical protein [Bacteroidales bacterium]
MSNPDINLFRDEEFEEVKLTPEKVVCLGLEFESDEARRAYFREELRKKLPELRQIEGFPIGEDEDIINLSDPPYYTACPNPWLNDFIAEWEQEKVELEKQGKRSAEFEVKEPYASDVSEGKRNPIYDAHTYHTKVPHPAIVKYMSHYTQPGDIVFDGFSGSGMTGVAACQCHRKAICSDLSPFASFLSSFFNRKKTSAFITKATRIITELENEYKWLFQTTTDNKNRLSVQSYIWSEVFGCPQCSKEIVFYDVAYDKDSDSIKEDMKCPYCGTSISKRNLLKITDKKYDQYTNSISNERKYVPVSVKYKQGRNTYYKTFDDFDFKILERSTAIPVETWIPSQKIEKGSKTMEAINHGIEFVHQFYSHRNLLLLSILADKIGDDHDLKAWFTSQLVNVSKLNRYRPGVSFPYNPMNGTFYVSSLICEANIFDAYKNKLNKLSNIIELLNENNVISTNSATCLSLHKNSIDYIFVDPPFGANIMYSDLNTIWEGWLKVSTNQETEAIVNSFQNKTLFDYQQLMQISFREFYRILKPNKWMTVEFSNTSASVWNSIQHTLQNVGFVIVNVSALDKKQGSFNAVTSTTAVKQDLVITCYKPTDELISKFEQSTDKSVNAMDFIEELLYHLPVHLEKNNSTTAVIERSPKILYDRLISYYVQHGYAIPMDAQEFQKALRERFIERDGMFFTASQTVEYEAKKEKTDGIVPMALFISSEAEGIEWLKRELAEPQTYQEILPNWMKDMVAPKKGDVLPELATILEENFIKDEDGKWRRPDAEKAADLELLRGKKLMKEFNLYLEQASKPKAKRMKDTRLEVLRYGFKECYKQKNYQAIVTVGDHIQESLLQEDEVLLQYYDIASMRV